MYLVLGRRCIGNEKVLEEIPTFEVEENAQNFLNSSFIIGSVKPKVCFYRIEAVLMIWGRRLTNILFFVVQPMNPWSVTVGPRTKILFI